MTFPRLARRAIRTKLRIGVALIALSGLGAFPIALHAQSEQEREHKPSPVPKEQLAHIEALSDAFKTVSRSASASVVNIRSVQRPNRSATPQPSQPAPFDDDFFRRFFGDDVPEGLREFRFGPDMTPQPRIGEGTGVIVREDGYIVTNNHVIAGATEILVTLNDDSEHTGTVVGADPETDLAVVRIDASGLTPASYGNSDNVEVGEWVLAIGSPLGLQQTVTAGIISAKGRGNLGLADIGDFIQTDAAINPGNSGGPLVNLYGEVVGINTAISTRTGGYMGVGFAIPSNMVKPVVNSIIETGKVQRGWLGVSIQPLTQELARSFEFEGTGVLIGDVLPNTPAHDAGLSAGDIVTQINGRTVSNPNQLLGIVAETPPGKEIQLDVFRDGERRNFTVTLGDRSQQQEQLGRSGSRRPGAPEQPAEGLGMMVQPLTPEMARQFGLGDRSGVVVERVEPASPAARAGLAAGDVITRVGEHNIRSMNDFNRAMEEADLTAGVRLQVFTNGSMHFVFLKAPQS